jgi:hypothetical protein
MKRGQLGRVFAFDAEKRSESNVSMPSDSLRVPTVDERAELYLRAVHGARKYSSEEMAEARGRMLDALAADLATRSGLALPDELEASRDAAPIGGFVLPDDPLPDPDSAFLYHAVPKWRGQRFWVGGTAVGVLTVALIAVLGPMVWHSLQERGYFIDRRGTVIAEATRAQESNGAQSSRGSLKLPGDGPRIVKEVAGSRAKDSAPPESAIAPAKPALSNLVPQLVLISAKPHRQGEPAPLGASLRGGAGRGSIMVTGLPVGSTLSAGRQAEDDGWRLAAADLNGVLVNPPRGFVGAMDLSIELHLIDDTVVDRKQLRLEWTQTEVPVAPN